MTKNSFEVDVVVNGSAAKEYRKDGSTYIEGRKGQSFGIRIRNHSAERILAIPTIDGLSVIDGKTGSYESGGYVIGPFDSTTIHGWRTSDKEVAEFYFSDTKESYAAKTDNGGNQGVIGVAIYRGKQPIQYTFVKEVIKETKPCPWCPLCPWQHQIENGTADISPWTWHTNTTHDSNANNLLFCASCNPTNSFSNMAQQAIGTGFGETRHSEIEKVSFDRDHIAEVFTIYYNTRSELEKLGINFRSDRLQYVAPQAFPGEYCKPPQR